MVKMYRPYQELTKPLSNNRRSPSYEIRLAKYTERGYGISDNNRFWIPALDRNTVNSNRYIYIHVTTKLRYKETRGIFYGVNSTMTICFWIEMFMSSLDVGEIIKEL